ncbi:MAG: hypothetical protein HN580_20895 [Deltaproteobacteria bacterium]|jgi:hypothetical protein|nr:hypothetical protein [Deltaproteobacteria bacterium]MBT4088629.1 hypothetical protein [Deltaproteobacteria bacterium]MBT4269135.1 hypothetical protein [Deltaproteobacteria bacterium]MBT4641311.1 hypothetical protein [Deltaproteobacteria bacterium]MBT7712847.1 hypothetical protein [Deltaproteobacteria bacterium]
MKSVIIDASSAILLYKAELIAQLVSNYRTLITPAVYDELTLRGYPGSETFRLLCDKNQIQVLTLQDQKIIRRNSFPALPTLNRGERDTIRQHMLGMGDFIMIDDGQALKYCKKAGLSFINALLFPRILFLTRSISESEYQKKSAEIIKNGRYSKNIIQIALNFSNQAIQPFLPFSN